MNQNDHSHNSKASPEVGDWVRINESNRTGQLDSIHGSEAVVITTGELRVRTKYQNLTKVTDENDIQQTSSRRAHIRYERKIIEPRLDIHGLRAEEAAKKVTGYLDDALVSNRNEVEIMHGKGTGALKKLVHDILDNRDDVKSYRMAPLVRGGAGCTIVRL